MRKNKKNWEIFSKSWKENAIVCDHIPTTPALVTTTHNRENTMMVETMNEGKDKYKVMYYAYYNDQTVLGLPEIRNNEIKSVKFYFDNKSDIKKVINYHVKTKWWLKDIKENTIIKVAQ